MILEYCKWDPQIGDESVLLNQPMILDAETWTRLATAAERMAAETAGVEAELLERPQLMPSLGMPSSLLRVFRFLDATDFAPAVRTLRFDFHPTLEGWKVSEVNSDVPGGFTESSHFPAMMAEHYPLMRPAGNPLRAWSRAMTSSISAAEVAILYAPGYMEDQQVASLLGATLQQEECAVHFIQHPGGIRWRDGKACLDGTRSMVPLDAIVRFYQGEWLGNLPRRTGWHHLFSKSRTMVTNPGYAILAESKRLPLVWGQLSSPTDTLKAMFPECREPREVDSQEEEWVFKPAFSNTGDDVILPSLLDQATWKSLRATILRHPQRWVAQRRFLAARVRADSGEFSPCIGVYTINGKAEGAYVRLARGPVVEYRASEAALLIEDVHGGQQ
jgi:glutathionylspermidine synthase